MNHIYTVLKWKQKGNKKNIIYDPMLFNAKTSPLSFFYVKHREKKNRYRNEQMLFIEVKNEK